MQGINGGEGTWGLQEPQEPRHFGLNPLLNTSRSHLAFCETGVTDPQRFDSDPDSKIIKWQELSHTK